jgi:hypothetical protein
VTKEDGDRDGTSKGGEIRHNVLDRGNESLVHMGDSYEDSTREGHGQEQAHHSRSLAEVPQDRPPTTMALAHDAGYRAAACASVPAFGVKPSIATADHGRFGGGPAVNPTSHDPTETLPTSTDTCQL